MFALALIVVIIASQTTILAGFEILEKKETEVQTERAFEALNRELTDLDTLTFDNAAWDETYTFITTNDTAYIENNWNNPCLTNARLNLVVFINNSGIVIYGRAYDTVGESTEAIFNQVNVLFPQDLILWMLQSPENNTKGLLKIDGELFLIASRPILKSDFTGPVGGALILGRQVTGILETSLTEQTHLTTVRLTDSSSKDLPLNLTNAIANLPTVGSVYVHVEGSDSIAGYKLVGDLNGNSCAVLSIDLPRDIYAQGSSTVTILTILMVIFFVFFGIAANLFLEFSLLSRISWLTMKLQEMVFTGNIKQRLSIGKSSFGSMDDELSTMKDSINALLDKIDEMSVSLASSQRLAVVGELAVMVAHDLRNPLQGMTVAVDYLAREDGSSPEKRSRAIQLVKRDIIYCEKIVHDLLDYSRETKTMPTETDVHSLLAVSLTHIQVPESTRINDLTTPEPKIHVDSKMMIRVFDNLLRNAIEAMPQGGSLTVKNEVSSGAMNVVFADTGIGIEKHNMPKLFTPLFTTKAKGMGFGLSICKRIVEAHQGSISVDSSPEKGSTFTVSIPVKDDLSSNGD